MKKKTSKKQAIRDDRGRLMKGSTANPNGRPLKGYSITEMFQSMFSEKPETKQALRNVILKKALAGDVTAIKLIWNYMDGSPPQNVDVSSKGEKIGDIYGFIQQAISASNIKDAK